MTVNSIKRASQSSRASWSDGDHLSRDLDAKLRRRFDHLDPDMVKAVLAAVQREFDGAPIRSFVDILAEREAVERLSALPGTARTGVP